MIQADKPKRLFPDVGDGSGMSQSDHLYPEEIQLATRNRGMPLEALRFPITPTGLHYLLVHYDIPLISTETWRLEIGGMVANPITLTLDDIRRRPSAKLAVTMECAGNGRALLSPRRISQPWLLEAIGTAEWTGTPLHLILEETGLLTDASELVFTGIDRGVEGGIVQNYQRSLSIEDSTKEEVLLAYEMNGQPLQPQHGFPLRLLVPGWYGMTSVKWLSRIEAVPEPFEGYQMVKAYRYAESISDPGKPISLMKVRALMVPPGIPDFLTRARLVQAGEILLEGRAWAGGTGVARVEVSTDGGSTWFETNLDREASPYAWRGWNARWMAEPGNFILSVRATDGLGNRQPSNPPWNTGGYCNNMIQSVRVIVE